MKRKGYGKKRSWHLPGLKEANHDKPVRITYCRTEIWTRDLLHVVNFGLLLSGGISRMVHGRTVILWSRAAQIVARLETAMAGNILC
jgi:hypothetical protein